MKRIKSKSSDPIDCHRVPFLQTDADLSQEPELMAYRKVKYKINVVTDENREEKGLFGRLINTLKAPLGAPQVRAQCIILCGLNHHATSNATA